MASAGFNWFGVLAWVLLALGAVVVVLALFGDRSRGRRRCRKCWYSLEGSPGLTCPECGCVAAAEGQLQRTRRHPWWAALGVVILLGSLASWKLPGAVRDGWRTVIPTWAMLTLMSPDPDTWLGTSGGSRALVNEFVMRTGRDEISRGAAARWARLVEARFSSRGEYGCKGVDPERVALVIYDVRDLLDEATEDYPWNSRRDYAAILMATITDMVEPVIWRDNGGTIGIVCSVGDLLFVRAPERAHAKIAMLQRALREAKPGAPVLAGNSSPDTSATEPLTILKVYAIQDLLPADPKARLGWSIEITAAILQSIEPDTWLDNGGDVGRIRRAPGKLVIATTPPIHAQVQALIESLRAAGDKMVERLAELKNAAR